jgi:D-arabinose 1-dehydrogenase-like Zn-dependent alcohol dehydrogenase
MRPRHLREYTKVIGLEDVSEHLDRMLARQTQGRILVDPWN